MKDVFLSLIRLGIGRQTDIVPRPIDWEVIEGLAERHGLLSVVVDGVQQLLENLRPPQLIWLRWIGKAMQNEAQYTAQQKDAIDLAFFFHSNGIRTYVLKGAIVAECYPKPSCRLSADFDCFLTEEFKGLRSSSGSRLQEEVWEKGNQLIENVGFEVKRNFYKNSTFYLPGLTVENHQFLTSFRGNGRLKQLERWFQSQFKSLRVQEVQEGARFEGAWLCRPPVMVSALFLIEHAYSHFLHEGLTWRHVLDWVMFSKKHKDEINWNALDAQIDEYGFRKFYDSYYKLGQYLLGDIDESSLTNLDKRMLKDVWSELTLPKSGSGLKNKLSIARNTMQARWKYSYFTEISMLQALLIQVKGFLFMKNPTLN